MSLPTDEEPDVFPPATGPRLSVWRLRVDAAPVPLVLRRDRPFRSDALYVPTSDVVRYASTARQTLKGPLLLEIGGPGDPLASAGEVLRALALVHEHHPDILTSLTIDGPLLNEYARELVELGLNRVTLRLDSLREDTTRRFVERAVYRAELLDRDEAARLLVEECRRAFSVAQQAKLPIAVRTTLLPTLNLDEISEIAAFAADRGAERMDLAMPSRDESAALAVPGATATDLAEARAEVHAAFAARARDERGPAQLAWLAPDNVRDVDLAALDAVDVLDVLPDPEAPLVPETPERGKVLPPRRRALVAVCSSDGTMVDRPLARATELRVYLVEADEVRLVARRALAKDKRRLDDGVGDAQKLLAALVGVSGLVATEFTPRGVTLLQAVGIRPLSATGAIEEVLDRAARGTLR